MMDDKFNGHGLPEGESWLAWRNYVLKELTEQSKQIESMTVEIVKMGLELRERKAEARIAGAVAALVISAGVNVVIKVLGQ